MSLITEEQLEQLCIDLFVELGYEYKEMILEKLFLKTD